MQVFPPVHLEGTVLSGDYPVAVDTPNRRNAALKDEDGLPLPPGQSPAFDRQTMVGNYQLVGGSGPMPAVASSSLAAGRTFAVWLVDQNFNRQAKVDVPVPMPPLLLYQGFYYVWNRRQFAYTHVEVYTPTADLGAPELSVVSDIQGGWTN